MIQLKLNKNVGGNCYPDTSDVMIVQACLANIKIKTKFGTKPLWQGKIDGKNSRELVAAIETFQCCENIKSTGKVEAFGGQTWSRLKQKTSPAIMASLATTIAQAAPSPGQQKHYVLASGVKLTPTIEKKVAQIANAYHAVTNKNIVVTSGTRSPATQAKAMFGNLKKRRNWLNIYKNQTLAGQIGNAFDTAQATGLSDQTTIAAMTQVIANQVASGQYISKHLVSGAVDIAITNISTPTEKTAFRNAASKVAKTVILETVEPHWHLQF